MKQIKVKDVLEEVGDGINEEDLIKLEHRYIREEIMDFIYMLIILLMVLIATIELKTQFSIDIFPGTDIPIDDIYYEIKES
jgi:hypothetical protein